MTYPQLVSFQPLSLRSRNRAGIVFTEATPVQKEGRISHSCPGLRTDNQMLDHAQIAEFSLFNGALPAINSGMRREALASTPSSSFGPSNPAGDWPHA